MRHSACFGLLIVFFLSPILASQSPAETKDPEALLKDLGRIDFDLQRVLSIRDFSLRRDPFTITFDRGQIIFLRPVGDLVTGLYFWGSGTIVGIPPTKTERQQLNLFTGSPVLNEHFREALIWFSDNTYDELMQQVQAGGENLESHSSLSSALFQPFLHESSLTHYRIVADLMNGRKAPLFSARIFGTKLGAFNFTVDWRKPESVSLGQVQQSGGRIYYDSWCSFAQGLLRPVPASRLDPEVAARFRWDTTIDVLSYQIDTQIDRQDRISGSTEIEFKSEQEGEWVLSFDLARSLKVSEVLDEGQRVLTYYQNSDMSSEEEVSKLGHDLIVVLLKRPLHPGETRRLKFAYSGDVISRMGNGVFYVGARGSWYPNTGVSDRARYRLSFRYPKVYTIVATGDPVRDWEEGDQKHSLWESRSDLPIAGFNYGDYVKKTALAGKIQVEVYANRSIENLYLEVLSRQEEIKEAIQQRRASGRGGVEGLQEFVAAAPDFSDFDTTRFSDEIARKVVKAVLFLEPIMGDFPFSRLAVSQIPGRFSQGWPSLLYISSLSFLRPEQRVQLGIGHDQEAGFLECLHAHEIAHQWWGNQVSWKSYHDLWMFEGFSNYLAYLFMKETHPGGRQFRELMRHSKEKLLVKGSAGQTYESAGPLWLGARLSSSKFPDGYTNLIYNKGAWVLHMLRYLMQDPNSGSDQNFFSLMRDFLTTYRSQAVSTEDFKRMVEKKMERAMDLEGNARMDWFFSQWVYETGIPTYRLESTVTALKSGQFLLKGKIKQQNVSEEFMMPVEVFGRFAPNRVECLGRVVVAGNETAFRFTIKSKPQKVTLDENNEILCENKTL
jgi:Peptidase family M1 domain